MWYTYYTVGNTSPQYVSETKRAFQIRVNEYLADIKHQQDKPVSNHYKNKEHHKTVPEYYILEHLTGDPEKCQNRTRQTERNWIYNLGSHTPYGMNTMASSGICFVVDLIQLNSTQFNSTTYVSLRILQSMLATEICPRTGHKNGS